MTAVRAGERWGSYVLEAHLASGGMAEVFRGRRLGAAAFSKPVCLKRLHAHLSDDPAFVALFLDEARTGARLHHRNIVAIDDLGVHEGRYFLAMEFVNGVDLAQLEGRLRAAHETVSAEIAAYVGAELLAALDAAHTAVDPTDGTPLRVIHRDVSPHNVMVSYAGEVKLADFGIAHAARRAHVTEGGVVRGRFGYMPLEQASAGTIDPRADLFALGVTLFELLTGRRPFDGETLEAIVAAQLSDARPALRALRPDLPAGLVDLIESLLAQDRERRPASAAEALACVHGWGVARAGGLALANRMATLYPAMASVASSSELHALPHADTVRARSGGTRRWLALPLAVGLVAISLWAMRPRARSTVMHAWRATLPTLRAAPPAVPRVDVPVTAPMTLRAAPTLRVIALPWGRVTIDGQPRGAAPVRVVLSPGVHTVRVTGGVDHDETVRLAPGESRVITARAHE